MIAISRADLQTLPYEVLEPIVFIFLTVLSLNFLGDVVRARFDVRESAI
jgi:peptide/nickel transport system permease protein